MKKNIFFFLLIIYFLSPSIIIAAPTPPVEAKECKSDNYERCFWLGYFNQSKKLAAKISLHRGCKKKNEIACFSESYLDYRYSTLKDESLIMKRLSQGCFDGIALSCALLGRHQEKSPGNRIYFDSIKELYSLSCEQKNSFGCANLGEYLEKKETTKWVDVEPWYIRACYDGIAEYCRKIGDHFQNSKQNNLAGHWLGQACNLDRSHCFSAGFFEEHFGKAKHAQQYYSMICYWEQRDKNCDTLLEKIKVRFLSLYQGGILIHTEVGLLPENPMGIQLSILCNKTWGPACDMLGEIEKQRGNKNDAIKYNHLSCDKGEYSKGFLKENPSFRNFEGCYRLGKIEEIKTGRLGSGSKLFQKSCHKGNLEGCLEYASFGRDKGDDDIVREAYQAGCDLHSRSLCVLLSNLEKKLAHPEEALVAHMKACSRGKDMLTCSLFCPEGKRSVKYGDSCYRLGGQFREIQEYSLAKRYLQAGCKSENQKSCIDLGDLELKLGNFKMARTIWNKACEGGKNHACMKLIETAKIDIP